jgi:hypothetical protein
VPYPISPIVQSAGKSPPPVLRLLNDPPQGIFACMIQSQLVSGKFTPYRFFTMQLAIRKAQKAPVTIQEASQAIPVKAI